MNVRAVFLHYLGDMLSSFFVLISGIIIYVADEASWGHYLDPAASLVITILIFWSSIPLVRQCLLVLLQKVPGHINVDEISLEISKVKGVAGVHDFHVWELADNIIIASAHISRHQDSNEISISAEVKKILHSHGLHSSTIQMETLKTPSHPVYCPENCVKNCTEEWCCDKLKESELKNMKHYNTIDKHEDNCNDHNDHDDHSGHSHSHSHGHDHGHGHNDDDVPELEEVEDDHKH